MHKLLNVAELSFLCPKGSIFNFVNVDEVNIDPLYFSSILVTFKSYIQNPVKPSDKALRKSS